MGSNPALEYGIILAAIFGFYLIIIRPAQRRRREMGELQDQISEGDRVLLSSGIFGTVQALDGERLRVEVATDVVIEIMRGAVLRNISAEEAASEDAPGRNN